MQLESTSTQRAMLSATALPTKSKRSLSEPPSRTNAAIPATETRAAINPYSIAVAPERASIRRWKDKRRRKAAQRPPSAREVRVCLIESVAIPSDLSCGGHPEPGTRFCIPNVKDSFKKRNIFRQSDDIL